ncbi:hypothetical protein LCGC14_1715990 [marine sediment metagenome]|uniref:Uncharacterized protein n=1 Tax=marine sediment metagenome TaxID=412755 RepID=A0A0F9KDR7_9ZZZZ
MNQSQPDLEILGGNEMKCGDCKFLSEPEILGASEGFPSVRCTKGLWDKGCPQWYSYGSSQRNRGPVRRYGEKCNQGELK